MAIESVIDSLTSGVKTSEEIEGDPYCFRVSWIRWNSGFRGSGLRIGDRVIALDGVRYEAARRKEFHHKAFGSYSEDQHWKEVGAKDGTVTTVTVKRGREILQVKGRILAERRWRNERERPTIGPDGPETLVDDGFGSVWSTWLERSIEDFGSRILDGGWRRGTVSNSRMMLKDHLEEKPRVDFLVKTYPGPFAQATLEDWNAIRDGLQGTRYEIRPEDLAWRELGEKRRDGIAAAGKAARETLLTRLAPETIPPFPAVDAIHGDRSTVAGKVVSLPPLRNRNWAMMSGRGFLVAGSAREGFYILDSASEGFQRAMTASWRYQHSIVPSVPEVYSVIGRILPDPRMLVVEGVAIAGLGVEPLGVGFGDALFVDLTAGDTFAGEETLADATLQPPPDDAPPEAVMAAFFQAQKVGAEEVWKSLYATWEASLWDGEPWYKPIAGPSRSTLGSEWVRSRRLLENAVEDVRVAAVDEPTVLVRGTEFQGAPRIEQVVLETDHVGLFDGEHRAYKDVNTNRVWVLQRRDGGPWRIVTGKAI